MKKSALWFIMLCCVLTTMLTYPAQAKSAPSVLLAYGTSFSSLTVPEEYTTPEYLEKFQKLFPQTATILLTDGSEHEVPVLREWTFTDENGKRRWTNTASLKDLPDGTQDPRGRLDEVDIQLCTGRYGGMRLDSTPPVIGSQGTFTADAWHKRTHLKLWQFPADGSAPVLRAVEADNGYTSNVIESQFRHTVNAWTAEDAGEWFGFSCDLDSNNPFLLDSVTVQPETNRVTAVKSLDKVYLGGDYATPLEDIGKLLPRTVSIILLDGQSISTTVTGQWTPEPENNRWTNAIDTTVLPESVEDTDALLTHIAIPWEKRALAGYIPYAGGISYPEYSYLLGTDGAFVIDQFEYATTMELWQFPADGSDPVRRADLSSGIYPFNEAFSAGYFHLDKPTTISQRYRYDVEAWTAEDAGEWIGLYYSPDLLVRPEKVAYLTTSRIITPYAFSFTFNPSGGTLEGADTYYTTCSDNIWRLETFPPNPVRPNYRFEGWYTRAYGGKLLDVTQEGIPLETTDRPWPQNVTLYAHWSRETPLTPAISTGQELQVIRVPGDPDIPQSRDLGHSSPGSFSNLGTKFYSNLYQNADGSFTTVDRTGNGAILVTTWDRNFQKTGEKEIPRELDIFGGFYHGERYNYLVFGQENMEEDDSKEVIRVVKYDQEFNRLAAAAVRNCYTTIPFRVDSCSIAETGNRMTIHTGRDRYQEGDRHHESSLYIFLNTDTMTVENNLGAFQNHHVSHSMNQFVLHDGESRVLLDHGDGAPREITLVRYGLSTYTYSGAASLMDIPGTVGYNWTGVSVGGFGQSQDFYLVTASTVRQEFVKYNGIIGNSNTDGHTLDSDERDILLLCCPKDLADLYSTRGSLLTDNYKTGTTAGRPYLVQAGENRYVILWQEFFEVSDRLGQDRKQSVGVRYAVTDGSGEVLKGPLLLPDAWLSAHCQPIADGDSVIWYVNEAEMQYSRSFYRLSLSDNADPGTMNPPVSVELKNVALSSSLAGSSVSATIVGIPAPGSKVFAALYHENGKMIALNAVDAITGTVSISLPTEAEKNGYVNVFLLDSIFRPQCLAKRLFFYK